MKLLQRFNHLRELRGSPHWLSLAASTTASDLSQHQWLIVLWVALVFSAVTGLVLFVVKSFLEFLDKAGGDISDLDSECSQKGSARGHHKHHTMQLGRKHTGQMLSARGPEEEPSIHFPDDELRQATLEVPQKDPLSARQEASGRPAVPPLQLGSSLPKLESPRPQETLAEEADTATWPTAERSGSNVQQGDDQSPTSSFSLGRPKTSGSLGGNRIRGVFLGGFAGRGHSDVQRDKDVESIPEQDENDDDEDGIYKVNGGAIVDDFGISGLCLVSHGNKQLLTVVLLACQAFLIQGLILAFIARSLNPIPNQPLRADKNVIVDCAIYLQFINSVRDLPRSLFILRWFHQVHETWLETCVFGCIYITDAFVTPMLQLFIGSLFLCTSATVTDVILNSCAVAFISNIDNMMLEVRKQMHDLALYEEEFHDVRFPVDTKLVNALGLTLCVVPVFPMAFSITIGHIGLVVFRL